MGVVWNTSVSLSRLWSESKFLKKLIEKIKTLFFNISTHRPKPLVPGTLDAKFIFDRNGSPDPNNPEEHRLIEENGDEQQQVKLGPENGVPTTATDILVNATAALEITSSNNP